MMGRLAIGPKLLAVIPGSSASASAIVVLRRRNNSSPSMTSTGCAVSSTVRRSGVAVIRTSSRVVRASVVGVVPVAVVPVAVVPVV